MESIDATIARIDQMHKDMLNSWNITIIKDGLQNTLMMTNTLLNMGQLTLDEFSRFEEQHRLIEEHIQELMREEFYETSKEAYT